MTASLLELLVSRRSMLLRVARHRFPLPEDDSHHPSPGAPRASYDSGWTATDRRVRLAQSRAGGQSATRSGGRAASLCRSSPAFGPASVAFGRVFESNDPRGAAHRKNLHDEAFGARRRSTRGHPRGYGVAIRSSTRPRPAPVRCICFGGQYRQSNERSRTCAGTCVAQTFIDPCAGARHPYGA
jgi:hypothetical protein